MKLSSSFLADASKLTTGQIVTQAIGYLSIPIITRIYGSDVIGEVATFFAIVVILAEFSGLGYAPAIMLARLAKHVIILHCMVIILTFVYSFLVLITIILGWGYIANSPGIFHNPLIIWAIPLVTLSHGFSQSLRFLNLKEGAFRRIAISNVLASIFENSALIFLGMKGYVNVIPMVAVQVITGYIRIIFLSRNLSDKYSTINIQKHLLSKFFVLIKKYKKFPIFMLPGNLFSRLSAQLPVLIIAILFAENQVAFYTVCLRLLKAPINLIGASISSVILQRLSHSSDEERRVLVQKVYQQMFRYGLVPLLVFLSNSELIFTFYLGEGWAQAGAFAKYISIYLFFEFLSIPARNLIIILQKQQIRLFLDISNAMLFIFSFFIGSIYSSIELSFLLLSIVISTLNIMFIVYMYGLIQVPINWFTLPVKNALVPAITFLLLFIITQLLSLNSTIEVVVSLIYLAVYFFIEFRQSLFNINHIINHKKYVD